MTNKSPCFTKGYKMSQSGTHSKEPIITFLAEIVETKQRKTASLDNVYTLQLRTDDMRIIELAKVPSDSLVKVSIELES